jgi:outer membrane murein-binding lipoprotein Lpp
MGMAIGLIGGVISAAGSVMGGMAAQQQAEYQAQIAEMNARVARINANRAILRGQTDAQNQDAKTQSMLGQQEAIQSASGLSITGKSAMLTRRSAAMLGRLDTLNVINDSQVEAYNYKVQAAEFTATAAAQRAAGENSLLQGFLGGAGSLIGSASPTGFGSGAGALVSGGSTPAPVSNAYLF